jgi:ParB-like chromosome segregation protein Spo0J
MSPTFFELVPISDLRAKPSLPIPGDQDLTKVRDRIIDFGQDNPIVVNLSGEVIYGVDLYEAMRCLNFRYISAITVDDKNKADIKIAKTVALEYRKLKGEIRKFTSHAQLMVEMGADEENVSSFIEVLVRDFLQ